MQSLEVISLNLWQILISLGNLVIMYLILKRFLYSPVKRVLAERRTSLESQYNTAAEAERHAQASRDRYTEKLRGAQTEADRLVQVAAGNADRRSAEIIANAREKADGILRQAQIEIELERKKALAQIRHEIADISTQLAQKILDREIQMEDHRAMIDAFLDNIGETHGRSE